MKKEIEKMDYSQMVGITRERNRPSGGIKTVHTIAVNAFINSSKKMLEIGSNTGFTSVSMSLFTGCQVIGVDINSDSVKEARNYAEDNGVEKKVKFRVATATTLPFPDNSFDIVWVSNVTSFIENKEIAIKEYLRVLKHGGIIVLIPIYYKKRVPKKIIQDVSDVIGAKINITSRKDWIQLFKEQATGSTLDLFYESDFEYLDRGKNIDKFVSMIMSKKHLERFGCSSKQALAQKYLKAMHLFNKNLKYCGYSILLFQKRLANEEPELFLTIKR